MLVSLVVILADRAGILRSAQLPRHMAAVVEVQALGRLQHLLADAVGVSGQRGQQQAPGEPTVVVVAVTVARLLVSTL